MAHFRRGFTLLELSIILLILGLLAGAFTVSEHLVRASQLQSILSEYQQYNNAVTAFSDKYKSLPGDYTGAIQLWGAANADPAACRTTIGIGRQTCNGDGNGLIGTLSDNGTYYETFRAWQHLANAEFIGQNLTGVEGAAGIGDRVVGGNVPASKMEGGGWALRSYTLHDIGLVIAGGTTPEIPYVAGDVPPIHVFWFGSDDINGSNMMQPTLTPAEAFGIDQKMDDGVPTTGKVVMQRNLFVNCYDTVTSLYLVDDDEPTCALVIKPNF